MDEGYGNIRFHQQKPQANDKFVILDDENIDSHGLFANQFIRTKFSTGLTKEDAEMAISILKGEN